MKASPKPIRPCRPSRAKNSSGRRTVIVGPPWPKIWRRPSGDSTMTLTGRRWTAAMKRRRATTAETAARVPVGTTSSPGHLVPVRAVESIVMTLLVDGGWSRVDAESPRPEPHTMHSDQEGPADAAGAVRQIHLGHGPSRPAAQPLARDARAEDRAVVGVQGDGEAQPVVGSRDRELVGAVDAVERRDVQLLVGAGATLRIRVHEIGVPVAVRVVHLDDRARGGAVAVEAPEDRDRVEAVPEAARMRGHQDPALAASRCQVDTMPGEVAATFPRSVACGQPRWSRASNRPSIPWSGR